MDSQSPKTSTNRQFAAIRSIASLQYQEPLEFGPSRPVRAVELNENLPASAPIQKPLPQPPKRLREGWRSVVALNCLANLVALIANLMFLIWGNRQALSDSGTRIIWSGSRDEQKVVEVLIHIGINVISTIILAGSNYTLQVLLAPSRTDVDRAHIANHSLDIGISSSRNWPYLCWRRKLLYVSLLVLTIPIHLLYNSIAFSTHISFDVNSAGIVTSDFRQPMTNGAADMMSDWTPSTADSDPNWIELTYAECYSYLQLDINSKYSNFLIITDLLSSSQNSNAFFTGQKPCGEWTPPGSWLSTFEIMTGQATISNNFSSVLESNVPFYMNDTDPTIALCQCTENSNGSYTRYDSVEQYDTTTGVQSCWAEMAPNFNVTIQLIPQLLVAVIVCNCLKIVIQCLVVFSNFDPLLTTGDAIASFLDCPDQSTESMGPISTYELLSAEFKLRRISPEYRIPWKFRYNSYFHGVKIHRWKFTMTGCFMCLLLLPNLIPQYSLSRVNTPSFTVVGAWTSADTVYQSSSLISAAVTVNAPQLALAIMNMSFNAVWTNMLLSKELMSYSNQKKGLRVTMPKGHQRSTLWLSLPLRYFTGLFLLSLASHWTLSQTLFLVYVRASHTDGTRVPANDIHGIGYFRDGLGVLVGLLALLNIVTFCYGMRKYKSAGPNIGSNSFCIGAACHVAGHDAHRVALEKLHYGVVWDASKNKKLIGFTNRNVRSLVEGEVYG